MPPKNNKKKEITGCVKDTTTVIPEPLPVETPNVIEIDIPSSSDDSEIESNQQDNIITNETVTDASNDKVPKKRGRKPKPKPEINISNINNQINTDDEDSDVALKTKRRGRKPKDKFKYESTDLDELSKNNHKEDNIIIKLPLSCLQLTEEFNMGTDLLPYNPKLTTPKPYNPEFNNLTKGNTSYEILNTDDNDSNEESLIYESTTPKPIINPNQFDHNTFNQQFENIKKKTKNSHTLIHFNDNSNTVINGKTSLVNSNYCVQCSHCKGDKNNENDVRQIDIILNNKYNSNTDKFFTLTHLVNCMNGDKWLNKTDVACLWCCHYFDNTPWGIPYKFNNGKFTIFGNFCMPNCALAYLLNHYSEDELLWDKVSLLNLLYFKVHGLYKSLVPSFDKLSLKMFGGTLEIEEYRELISDNEKSYSVEFPPCNTIIPLLEEIYKKSNLNNTFIPVDKNRIQVANNELKLKRSKPIINHKNTLDFCLNNN